MIFIYQILNEKYKLNFLDSYYKKFKKYIERE